MIFGLILFWIVLIIIYGLIRRFLRRRVRKSGVSPDAINGLVIAVGLIFIYVAIISVLFILPEVYTYFVVVLGTSSLIIGSALGLAIGQSVRNFISGLYLIFTRPYHVEDYIRIGDVEGIVLEISMAYTSLLQPEGTEIKIPNGRVLESDVTNFLFELEDFKREYDQTAKIESQQESVLQQVRKVVEKNKIVRYVFNISFHTDRDLQVIRNALTSTCREWTDRFGFEPLYEISDATHLEFIFIFTIFVDSPRKIYQFRAPFIDDILDKVYLKTKRIK